jgi:hypothetical protein
MRKSGYTSQAELMTPAPLIDVRQGKPAPPERLSAEGKRLWIELVEARRAGWFNGAETTLESFIVVTLNCRRLEKALQGGGATIDARYEKISRLHRQACQQAAMLARGLRLLPSTNHPKRTPPDSPRPLPHQRTLLLPVPDDDLRNADGERDFSALRARVNASFSSPKPEQPEREGLEIASKPHGTEDAANGGAATNVLVENNDRRTEASGASD